MRNSLYILALVAFMTINCQSNYDKANKLLKVSEKAAKNAPKREYGQICKYNEQCPQDMRCRTNVLLGKNICSFKKRSRHYGCPCGYMKNELEMVSSNVLNAMHECVAGLHCSRYGINNLPPRCYYPENSRNAGHGCEHSEECKSDNMVCKNYKCVDTNQNKSGYFQPCKSTKNCEKGLRCHNPYEIEVCIWGKHSRKIGQTCSNKSWEIGPLEECEKGLECVENETGNERGGICKKVPTTQKVKKAKSGFNANCKDDMDCIDTLTCYEGKCRV